MTFRRLVNSDYELQDVADQLEISLEDAARDLALLAVMASLADDFGDRIIFKGGSALRFAHGATRTSRDTDATVVNPAKAPIPSDQVMAVIEKARMGQFLRYNLPKRPVTENKYSLDIDKIEFSCAEVAGTLDVELSFREALVLEPIRQPIGEPYFEPFEVFSMRPVEMAGEKLRTLAQRQRGTDLSDCVLVEELSKPELSDLPRVREKKFELVRKGIGAAELIERVDALQARYVRDVRAIEPGAPEYDMARAAALRLIKAAWP